MKIRMAIRFSLLRRGGGQITIYGRSQSERKRNFGQRFAQIQAVLRQKRRFGGVEEKTALRQTERKTQEKIGGGEKTQVLIPNP